MNLRRVWLALPLMAVLTLFASRGFGQDSAASPADDASTDIQPIAVSQDSSPGEIGAADEVTESSAPAYDTGDVAWMLISIGLVLMMTTPGLALFYGGLVRKKNILSVMMECVFLMGMMSVLWAAVGYSLAFGGDSPYIGNLEHVLLDKIEPTADDGNRANDVASAQIFAAFQGMFFIITPALICGAFAERMKFSTMAVFSAVWGLLIYCPIAHWVWAETGWLCEWNTAAKFHAIDFAGGLVVHISSGVSALICALVIGRRRGFPTEPMPPHNLTYTCIGTGLLWVGWFGFNGGSAGAANGVAVNAVIATHMAAAAGVLGWSLAELIKHGKASVLGACSGAVAGLVCITPASGSVTASSGIIMGFAAGLFCFWCCTGMKNRFGYDDSLDAFGIHGMGGIFGALLTGVFATTAVTGNDGAHGVLENNPRQMVPQIVSVIAAVAFSAIGTFIIVKVLEAVMGLRVSEEEEVRGLDLSQHGEDGYIFQ